MADGLMADAQDSAKIALAEAKLPKAAG